MTDTQSKANHCLTTCQLMGLAGAWIGEVGVFMEDTWELMSPGTVPNAAKSTILLI